MYVIIYDEQGKKDTIIKDAKVSEYKLGQLYSTLPIDLDKQVQAGLMEKLDNRTYKIKGVN